MQLNRIRRVPAAALALAAVSALTIAGCSGKPTPSPTTPSQTPSATVTKTQPPTPTEEVKAWPLTGVQGTVVSRPSVSVKIENSPESRPQTGLQAADVVYEEMVEGGIARYLAVFHSDLPKTVGPVRSIRPMDGPIAGPTKGLLAFSGGQARFQQDALDAGLQLFSDDAGAPGFSRSPEHRAPHNLFGSLDTFLQNADEQHQDAPPALFSYAADAASATAAKSGAKVTTLATSVSQIAHARWTWSGDDKAFLRFEGQVEASDAATNKQLRATNVVALNVTSRAAGGTDVAGTPIPETVLVDSKGTGVVASGGKSIEVKWSKKKAEDPIKLTTSDGKAVELAPGNTWVELCVEGVGGIATE